MATYVEMAKFESEAPQNVIRLVKSGEFYRAYDHSAWLFLQCVAQHKVIRKFVKSLDRDVLYIGFPEKSLIGNIAERKYSKTDFGYDIELKEEEQPDESGYEEWRTNVIAEQSSKADYHTLPLVGADAEREVIKRLKDFPMESKSLMECAMFLYELRKLLHNNI